MTEESRFHRWSLQEKDLEGLDPIKARDLIVKCFFEAQKETYARAKQDLGLKSDDDQLMASMTSSIKLIFKETGADFGSPTRESLMKVVETLGRKALSWGTPQDIIEFHRGQIEKVIRLLK